MKHAVIVSCGLDEKAPEGMSTLILHIPSSEVLNKSPFNIQDELGLPWSDGTNQGCWFTEIMEHTGIIPKNNTRDG